VGDDFLNGDRGCDTIAGGPGNDRIFGGLDEDVVSGDEGDDRISVVDGSVDRVTCGDGADTVFADVADVVAADCEVVRR
jgi:Ca2+-binding RTX toxin-like protein